MLMVLLHQQQLSGLMYEAVVYSTDTIPAVGTVLVQMRTRLGLMDCSRNLKRIGFVASDSAHNGSKQVMVAADSVPTRSR